ncbi:MAG: hypothetical protein Q4G33_04275 [bacterium]|nr:hypothetical protein [bacterium]
MPSRIITNGLIEKFRLYLYKEERSENAIEKYIRDIQSFIKFIDKTDLQKAEMLDYKRKLCESYAPRNVNSMLS